MKDTSTGHATCSAVKQVPRTFRMSLLLVSLVICATPIQSLAQNATTTTPLQLMSSQERTHIEHLLSGELQRVANEKKWFDGQTEPIYLSAKFDLQTNRVLIDIGKQYGTYSAGAAMEDLQGALFETSRQILEGTVPFEGIDLLFGGRDMYYYHPEQWRGPRSTLPPGGATRYGVSGYPNVPPITPVVPPLTFRPTVVISAGHGIYYNYQYKDWRPQRDPSNGITEDFITPVYATELKAWMDQRGSTDVVFPRAVPATIHVPSGSPWWQIGARYNLEQNLPDRSSIWHPRPELTDSLRERTEDIESRPLFANFVGADAILSIHTNAADSSASGTRVFHQAGRLSDQALGNNVLCYMSELIHAKENYSHYPVANTSYGDNYAENRIASMPAIIIEVGFHTNQSDALALRDPAFRTAAMKGVEKGYRLYTQGKSCQPFAIASIPEVTSPIGTPFTLQVSFKGYPQFPVKRTSKFVVCPNGWACTDTEEVIATQTDGPISIPRLCSGSSSIPTTTFTQRTTLTDTDGVSTSMEHRYTCTSGKQSLNDASAVGSPTAT